MMPEAAEAVWVTCAACFLPHAAYQAPDGDDRGIRWVGLLMRPHEIVLRLGARYERTERVRCAGSDGPALTGHHWGPASTPFGGSLTATRRLTPADEETLFAVPASGGTIEVGDLVEIRFPTPYYQHSDHDGEHAIVSSVKPWPWAGGPAVGLQPVNTTKPPGSFVADLQHLTLSRKARSRQP